MKFYYTYLDYIGVYSAFYRGWKYIYFKIELKEYSFNPEKE